MAKLTDAVSEYCASQHFLLHDSAAKTEAEPLLEWWCEAVGDVVTEEAMARALRGVAQLEAPLMARREFPALLRDFLEFLPTTGRFPLADEWADRVAGLAAQYGAAFRDDGSVRGQPVRRPAAPVGRNDPCPCGSGRKYKKCCMALLGP